MIIDQKGKEAECPRSHKNDICQRLDAAPSKIQFIVVWRIPSMYPHCKDLYSWEWDWRRIGSWGLDPPTSSINAEMFECYISIVDQGQCKTAISNLVWLIFLNQIYLFTSLVDIFKPNMFAYVFGWYFQTEYIRIRNWFSKYYSLTWLFLDVLASLYPCEYLKGGIQKTDTEKSAS